MIQIDSKQLHFYKKILIATLLGISSGLPLYVLIQLIPAWLRDSGIDLSTIGLFQLIGIPYAFKYLWAPFLERYALPFLGKRRGWMFICQLGLVFAIATMGLFDPTEHIATIVKLTVLMTVFSATQDIVIDAYRRELLDDDELGAGNAWFVNAYRFSSLIPGALALILADLIDWRYVFPIVALFMFIGLVTTLFISEQTSQIKSNNIFAAVIDPFKDYFSRYKLSSGLLIILFLLLYKLGDSMATALSTPFYLDLGYSKTIIGSVAKVAALWSSIAGAFIAGYVMRQLSINKSLWVFGVFQMVTILGFAWLSQLTTPGKLDLFMIVSLEYLGVGMGTVAIVSYMFKVSSKAFAATQIALFTAIAAIPRTFVNATTGFLVESLGYTQFFLLCTLCAIPGMLLLFYVAPWKAQNSA
ncbi:MAG TPA: MFS transporter [Oceanospirillales bacterium]|nr:MFS transporter [Oceanospirillales bacterium]